MALAASLRGGGGGGGGGSGMDMGTSGWSSMSNSSLLPAVSSAADLLSTRRRYGAAAAMMTEARAAAGEVSGEVWDGVGGETGYGTDNAILKNVLFLETAMINMLSISWNVYNSANCANAIVRKINTLSNSAYTNSYEMHLCM